MSLKCGIVGLPNVGKSTLFNALTKSGIAAENYPFCTIEPNVGIVEVPDPRLAQLVRHRQAAARAERHRRVRRYRRTGGGRQQGRRPGQPVPRQHPRDRRHRACRALLCTTRTSCTSRARSSRFPTSRPSRPSWPWPTSPRWSGRWRATRKPATGRRQGGEAAGGGARQVRSPAQRGQAGARARPLEGGAGEPQILLSDHRQADALRRQRRREGVSRTIRCWMPVAPHAARRAPVVPLCAAMEAEIADLEDEDKSDVPGRHGSGGAGPQPPDSRRLPASWACRPTSPPG
jgi:hypothetical protein